MAAILVAYYSRTGRTRLVADELARTLGADRLEIADLHSRKGLTGYLRSAREAMRGELPPIAPQHIGLTPYALVVLGTPVWAGHLSSPMRSFLHAHERELPRVAFFCTCGGSGAQRVFDEMRTLAGRQPEATCALTERDIAARRHREALEAFATRLRPAAAA